MELLQNALFDDDYVSLQLFLEMLNVKDAAEKERPCCKPYSITSDHDGRKRFWI